MVSANRRFSMRMYNLDPSPQLDFRTSMLCLPIVKGAGEHFLVFLTSFETNFINVIMLYMFLRRVCSRYGAYLKVSY